MGTDERSADLLFRLYRALRFRHTGDQRPFSSLRRAVEHEAFVSLLARDSGTRTPRLRAVSNVGKDSWLLAYEQIDGESLDSVPPDDFDDALLGEIWDEVGAAARASGRPPGPPPGERVPRRGPARVDHRLRVQRDQRGRRRCSTRTSRR